MSEKRGVRRVAQSFIVVIFLFIALQSMCSATLTPVTTVRLPETPTLGNGSAPHAVAVNETTGRIYTANGYSNNVTVVSVSSNAIMAVINVGKLPSGIALNQVTNKIYVTNGMDNTVSVIDGASSAVTATINVGKTPYGVAVNQVTNKIYVSNSLDNTVSVIDGANNTILATVSVGALPLEIAVNDVTNKIYVSNASSSSNSVSVIDGTSNSVTSTVAVGKFPIAVAVNKNTNKIYVANYSDYSVSVIDGATNSVTTTINSLGFIVDLAVDATMNIIYCIDNAFSSLSQIDGSTNTEMTSYLVGKYPGGLAVDETGKKVYVANTEGDSLSVFDAVTATVTATIAIGSRPRGLAVNEKTNNVYVTNSTRDSVSVLSGTGNLFSSTISVNNELYNYPFKIAVNETTNAIYVTQFYSGRTYKIDGNANSIVGTAVGDPFPIGVSVNETTDTIYAVSMGLMNGRISVFNGSDLASVSYIGSAGKDPSDVAVNEITNRIYAYDPANNTLTVFEGLTNSIITTINLGITSPFLNFLSAVPEIAVNELTNKIYVTSTGDNVVLKIDGATNAIESTITVGKMPSGVAVNEKTNMVYVANYFDNTISIIDGGMNIVVDTVNVGQLPSDIVVNEATKRVYVANSADGTVSIFDETTVSSPTSVSAAAGNGQATPTWSPVAGASSYNVYMASQSGVTKSNYATLPDGMQHVGVTSPYTHTGLTNGKTYYFVVTAVNSGGESSESTEASAKPVLETTAPVISSMSASDAGDTATITWTTDEPSDSIVDYGTTTGYGSTATSASLVSYHSVTLTGLSGNTSYNYRVKSTDTWGNTATSPNAAFTTKTKLKYTFPKGLTMISLPMAISSSAASLFGSALEKFGKWNPQGNAYDVSSSFNFSAGNGYWVKLASDKYFEVTGTPAPATQNFEVAIYPGWNQIGNPFLQTYLWENVSVKNKQSGVTKKLTDAAAAQWVGSYAWSYPGQAFGYQLTHPDKEGASRYLSPLYGYWIYSGIPGALVFHYDKIGAATAQKSGAESSDNILSVQLKAATDAAADDGSFFGITKTKTEDVIQKPPDPIENRLKTYFAGAGKQTASDFHFNPSQKEQVWDFIVQCDGTKNVTLSWDIKTLPPGAKLFLQDMESGSPLTMTGQNSMTVSVNEKKTFKIKYYKPSALSESGENGALFASKPYMFPNPDRTGNATFRYVTGPNVMRVGIEVYNLAGKLVDKFDGDLNGETHWLFGDRVAAGVYYYRITAYAADGKESVVGKMVVVR